MELSLFLKEYIFWIFFSPFAMCKTLKFGERKKKPGGEGGKKMAKAHVLPSIISNQFSDDENCNAVALEGLTVICLFSVVEVSQW